MQHLKRQPSPAVDLARMFTSNVMVMNRQTKCRSRAINCCSECVSTIMNLLAWASLSMHTASCHSNKKGYPPSNTS